MSKTNEELIAEFLAKKAATKIETGASSGITDRQWYVASKGDLDINQKIADNAAERAAERERERFAEARYMGASQDLAHRYATGELDCLCCGDL